MDVQAVDESTIVDCKAGMKSFIIFGISKASKYEPLYEKIGSPNGNNKGINQIKHLIYIGMSVSLIITPVID